MTIGILERCIRIKRSVKTVNVRKLSDNEFRDIGAERSSGANVQIVFDINLNAVDNQQYEMNRTLSV